MRKFSINLTLSLVLVVGLALQASALNIFYTGGGKYSFSFAPGQGNFDENYYTTSLLQTISIGFESNDGFAVIDLDTDSILFFYKDAKLDQVNDIRGDLELSFPRVLDDKVHSIAFSTDNSALYFNNCQTRELTFALDTSGFT
jgi:hypothetical protein